MENLRDTLTSPVVLIGWFAAVGLTVAVVAHDLARKNRQLVGLMRFVWILTVFYSGPLGLAVYYYSGRSQIPRETLWRRGFRSTAHCYSGCGVGEIAGVLLVAGLLGLGNAWIAGVSFVLAYAGGFSLTAGPLIQEGVPALRAFRDAFASETASIVVMEAVAVGVDLALARRATMGEPLFWSSLVVSLSVGFLAAYPVNVLLVHLGVKTGMHSPKEHPHGKH
jgi:hypothetical protein